MVTNRTDEVSDPAVVSEVTRFSGGEPPQGQPGGGEIPPGTVVGDYEVIGQLGSGGMGRVYRVRHLLSKRIEAMKLVLPDVEWHGFIERFQREIEVQASLNHPNICALHTAMRLGSGMALVMELAEGQPLTEALKDGPLEPRRAVEYVCQVLEALTHAHERGVVHRDVKPGNIIFTAGGQAKLVDFGIAKLAGSVELTMQGIAVGSPYYTAPEVIEGRRPDQRSDVYSTGVTLYEMVTGRRPIGGDSQFAILEGHLRVQPDAPDVVNPGVPKPLSDAILKALAKDPGQRFQTAGEFLAALRPVPQAVAAAPAATTPGRRRGLAAFAALMAAVTLALAGWRAFPSHRASEARVVPVTAAPSPQPVPTAPVSNAAKPAVPRQAKASEWKNPETAANFPATPTKAASPVLEAGMDSWGDVSWTAENGWYVHKGGLPALYPRAPQGSFVFTIYRRKGIARWVLRWRNSREYLLFEVDNHAFHRKQVRDGKNLELAVVRRKSMEEILTLQIDVSGGAITHRLWANGAWTVLDDWHDSIGDFTRGQFGFWPSAGKEIGLSNFKFMPAAAGAGGAEQSGRKPMR